MAYKKQTWVDLETPLDAEHMNHIENGLGELSEEKRETINIAFRTDVSHVDQYLRIGAAAQYGTNVAVEPFVGTMHRFEVHERHLSDAELAAFVAGMNT